MKNKNDIFDDIKIIYSKIKNDICVRLKEFEDTGISKDKNKIFAELSFCILTPQSNAKICWESIENLNKKKLLFDCSEEQIIEELRRVRFRKNKSKYILTARKNLDEIIKRVENVCDVFELREWLVSNIKGYGYKEASHFLRNIGLGKNIAILDRHILRNLKLFGVINDIPKTLSKKKYFEIEKKMSDFSRKINIPLSHLDMVFWYNAKNEIFK